MLKSSAIVQLRCHNSALPGFISVDKKQSVCTGSSCVMYYLLFNLHSVNVRYLFHSLVHIPKHYLRPLLRTLQTLLKPGGRVYISVPAFAVLSSLYISGRVSLVSIVRSINGGQHYPGNSHLMRYGFEISKTISVATGFTRIVLSPTEGNFLSDFIVTSTYEIRGGGRAALISTLMKSEY